jgi:CDGSH-type Zn-finger protein
VVGPRIVVVADGPYRVEGGVRLLRTAIVTSRFGEPTHWDEGPDFETEETYRLCRCGASATKPFCDDVCETNGFDGTETADRGPIAARRSSWDGDGVVLFDDGSLCTHAGFCTNRRTSVWGLATEASDEDAREEFVGMVHHCPSGRLEFAEADDRTGWWNPRSSRRSASARRLILGPRRRLVVSEDGAPCRSATARRSAGAGARPTSPSAMDAQAVGSGPAKPR